MGLKHFQIWIEGYAATGEHANARLLVEDAKGVDFADACRRWVDEQNARLSRNGLFDGKVEFEKQHGTFDAEDLSIWGCRLYPTEDEARSTFG